MKEGGVERKPINCFNLTEFKCVKVLFGLVQVSVIGQRPGLDQIITLTLVYTPTTNPPHKLLTSSRVDKKLKVNINKKRKLVAFQTKPCLAGALHFMFKDTVNDRL